MKQKYILTIILTVLLNSIYAQNTLLNKDNLDKIKERIAKMDAEQQPSLNFIKGIDSGIYLFDKKGVVNYVIDSSNVKKNKTNINILKVIDYRSLIVSYQNIPISYFMKPDFQKNYIASKKIYKEGSSVMEVGLNLLRKKGSKGSDRSRLIRLKPDSSDMPSNFVDTYNKRVPSQIYELLELLEGKFTIHQEDLESVFGKSKNLKAVVEAVNKYSKKYEINTSTRMAHFLGQIGVESKNLKDLTESCHYKKDNKDLKEFWLYVDSCG